MPTSAAALKREREGLPHKMVDPELSEKRRAAINSRKDRRKDATKQRAAMTPLGGPIDNRELASRDRVVVTKAVSLADVIRAKARNEMLEGAVDAARFLVKLVKGEGECAKAPFAVRRLAAVDLLTMSRTAMPNATDNDKDITEMTVEELQRQLLHIDQAIEGESHAVPDTNAAPLSPVSPQTTKTSTRQAIE